MTSEAQVGAVAENDVVVHLVTPENGRIPIWLLEMVKREAERVLPQLTHGRAYMSAEILAAIWDVLSKDDHKVAGRALKYLSTQRQVCLRYVGVTRQNKSLYMRMD